MSSQEIATTDTGTAHAVSVTKAETPSCTLAVSLPHLNHALSKVGPRLINHSSESQGSGIQATRAKGGRDIGKELVSYGGDGSPKTAVHLGGELSRRRKTICGLHVLLTGSQMLAILEIVTRLAGVLDVGSPLALGKPRQRLPLHASQNTVEYIPRTFYRGRQTVVLRGALATASTVEVRTR